MQESGTSTWRRGKRHEKNSNRFTIRIKGTQTDHSYDRYDCCNGSKKRTGFWDGSHNFERSAGSRELPFLLYLEEKKSSDVDLFDRALSND